MFISTDGAEPDRLWCFLARHRRFLLGNVANGTISAVSQGESLMVAALVGATGHPVIGTLPGCLGQLMARGF